MVAFYAFWQNFVTDLGFEWADKFNLAAAPNRPVSNCMGSVQHFVAARSIASVCNLVTCCFNVKIIFVEIMHVNVKHEQMIG